MAVREIGEVERVAAPGFTLDDYARSLRIDREHFGDLPVASPGPIVVTGEQKWLGLSAQARCPETWIAAD